MSRLADRLKYGLMLQVIISMGRTIFDHSGAIVLLTKKSHQRPNKALLSQKERKSKYINQTHKGRQSCCLFFYWHEKDNLSIAPICNIRESLILRFYYRHFVRGIDFLSCCQKPKYWYKYFSFSLYNKDKNKKRKKI